MEEGEASELLVNLFLFLEADQKRMNDRLELASLLNVLNWPNITEFLRIESQRSAATMSTAQRETNGRQNKQSTPVEAIRVVIPLPGKN